MWRIDIKCNYIFYVPSEKFSTYITRFQNDSPRDGSQTTCTVLVNKGSPYTYLTHSSILHFEFDKMVGPLLHLLISEDENWGFRPNPSALNDPLSLFPNCRVKPLHKIFFQKCPWNTRHSSPRRKRGMECFFVNSYTCSRTSLRHVIWGLWRQKHRLMRGAITYP